MSLAATVQREGLPAGGEDSPTLTAVFSELQKQQQRQQQVRKQFFLKKQEQSKDGEKSASCYCVI